MQNEQPLVSVLIPYYNDAKYLPKSIESVLSSDYSNIELILLNHATADNCREIAHSYTDSRIRHIDMPYNYGYGGGGMIVQTFLNEAKGKYVRLFCADDTMTPNGIGDLVDYMESNPDKDFAFGDVLYVDDNENSLNLLFSNTRPHFSFDGDEAYYLQWFAKNVSTLPYIGSIIRRESLTSIVFNKTYIMCFDMNLWTSLLCKGNKIGFTKKCVANYRCHYGQVSSFDNKERVLLFSHFEMSNFWSIFQSIPSIELCKKIWPNSNLVERLMAAEDIPFVVAAEFISTTSVVPAKVGLYNWLSNYFIELDNDKYCEETYGFGIRELRSVVGELLTNNCGSRMYNLKKRLQRVQFLPIDGLKVQDITLLLIAKLYRTYFYPIIEIFKGNKKPNY